MRYCDPMLASVRLGIGDSLLHEVKAMPMQSVEFTCRQKVIADRNLVKVKENIDNRAFAARVERRPERRAKQIDVADGHDGIVGADNIRTNIERLEREQGLEIAPTAVEIVVPGHEYRSIEIRRAPVPEFGRTFDIAHGRDIARKNQAVGSRLNAAVHHEAAVLGELQVEVGSVLKLHISFLRRLVEAPHVGSFWHIARATAASALSAFCARSSRLRPSIHSSSRLGKPTP